MDEDEASFGSLCIFEGSNELEVVEREGTDRALEIRVFDSPVL